MKKFLFIPFLFLFTFLCAQSAEETTAELQAEEATAELQAEDSSTSGEIIPLAAETPQEFIKQNPSLNEFLETQKQLWIQEKEATEVPPSEQTAEIQTVEEEVAPLEDSASPVTAPAEEEVVATVEAEPEVKAPVVKPAKAVAKKTAPKPAIKAQTKSAAAKAAPIKQDTVKIESIEVQEQEIPQEEGHDWFKFWMGVVFMLALAGGVVLLSKYQ